MSGIYEVSMSPTVASTSSPRSKLMIDFLICFACYGRLVRAVMLSMIGSTCIVITAFVAVIMANIILSDYIDSSRLDRFSSVSAIYSYTGLTIVMKLGLWYPDVDSI